MVEETDVMKAGQGKLEQRGKYVIEMTKRKVRVGRYGGVELDHVRN